MYYYFREHSYIVFMLQIVNVEKIIQQNDELQYEIKLKSVEHQIMYHTNYNKIIVASQIFFQFHKLNN